MTYSTNSLSRVLHIVFWDHPQGRQSKCHISTTSLGLAYQGCHLAQRPRHSSQTRRDYALPSVTLCASQCPGPSTTSHEHSSLVNQLCSQAEETGEGLREPVWPCARGWASFNQKSPDSHGPFTPPPPKMEQSNQGSGSQGSSLGLRKFSQGPG